MAGCVNCGGGLVFDIHKQTVVCTSCGAEGFDVGGNIAAEDGTQEASVFSCPQCGGEVYSSGNSLAGFCSYCGASVTMARRDARVKMPALVIPFKILKETCAEQYRKKLGRTWFVPGTMKEGYADSFRGVYMPYCVYGVGVDKDIAVELLDSYSDSSYNYTDHYKVSGRLHGNMFGFSHDLSSSFDDNLSESIDPYEVKDLVQYNPGYLNGFYADFSDVDPAVYSDFVMESAKKVAEDDITTQAKAAKNFRGHVTCKSSGAVGEALGINARRSALFPVWFMAYKHEDRVAYATVNGQTGKVSVDVPASPLKILLTSLWAGLASGIAVSFFFDISIYLFMVLMAIITLSGSIAAHVMLKGADNPNASVRTSGLMHNVAKAVLVPGVVVTLLKFNGMSIGMTMLASGVMAIAALVFLALSFSDIKRTCQWGSIAVFLMPAVCAVSLMLPIVSNVVYFAVAVAVFALTAVSVLALVGMYNMAATHKLPQFNIYRGGRDNA